MGENDEMSKTKHTVTVITTARGNVDEHGLAVTQQLTVACPARPYMHVNHA